MKNVTLKDVVLVTMAIIIITIACGCQASNKAHWNKVHPYGGWAGKNWIHGIDSIKTTARK